MDKHPILTAEELAKARSEAKAKRDKEARKHAYDLAVAEEMDRLDQEAALAEGRVGDEMVTITLDLPPFADRVALDGRIYMHGMNHTVRRRVADTLMEMAQRAWMHQNREVDGKKLRDFYQRPRASVVNGAGQVTNAPRTSG